LQSVGDNLQGMSSPQHPSRISPLAPEDQNEEQRTLLAFTAAPDMRAVNLFATLARHPGLLRRWIPFAAKLHTGNLPARHRELVILRTGWRCQADYEWGHHTLTSTAAGLTPADLDRIQTPSYDDWDPHEAALLRCADELHDRSTITDPTWQTLAATYDHQQLIDLVMLIGNYHLVCYTANALGIPREPDIPGFTHQPPRTPDGLGLFDGTFGS
jgi:4-carboxymuconolactone decarboxylase